MNRLLTAIPGKLMSEYVVQLLKKSSIMFVRDLLEADNDQLSKILHMHSDNVVLLKKQAIHYFGPKKCTLLTYLKTRKAVEAVYQTGIKGLDKLLSEDGFEQLCSGSIWDVGGLVSSGKTNFMITLALNFVSNYDGEAYFIDGKRDISGSRIYNMLKSRGADKSKCVQVMQSIRMDYVSTVEDVINILEVLLKKLSAGSEDVACIKMILIDSLPAALFHLYFEEKTKMKCHLAVLVMLIRKISKQHSVIFIVTNLMLPFHEKSDKEESDELWSQGNNFRRYDAHSQSNSENTNGRPFLGFPWKSVANLCLALELPKNSYSSDNTLVTDNSYRVLKVLSGCYTSTGVSCLVRLTETGII